jgi:hypothetical protein
MTRTKTPGLVKRGGSIWHYDVLVDGVRYQGSTRTPDLKTATLFVNQLRLDIARGKLALKDTRRTLTLDEVHQEFLASKTPSVSPLYLASLSAHWRVWLEPRLGNTPIDKIDASHLEGTAALTTLEEQLEVRLQATSLGHLDLEVDITPDHINETHQFRLEIDQSYLSDLIGDLQQVLGRYPLKNTEGLKH